MINKDTKIYSVPPGNEAVISLFSPEHRKYTFLSCFCGVILNVRVFRQGHSVLASYEEK
jgi:hypothetical protein